MMFLITGRCPHLIGANWGMKVEWKQIPYAMYSMKVQKFFAISPKNIVKGKKNPFQNI